MDIAKGKIGNALTSTADNHVVAVANDIYDEERKKYQSEINENSVIGKDDEGNEVYPGNVHSLVEGGEYLYVKCDADYRILWAIKSDGTIYYGVDIPLQVQDAINKVVEDLQVDVTSQIEDLGRIINEHLDELSKKIAENVFAIEMDDDGNLVAVTDEDSNVTEVGITDDGDIYADFNIE